MINAASFRILAVIKIPTCAYEACIQTREGMEVIDLVYTSSKHPVGLLGRRIISTRKLKLLANPL